MLEISKREGLLCNYLLGINLTKDLVDKRLKAVLGRVLFRGKGRGVV